MTKLTDLINIGTGMEKRLKDVGINTAEELMEIGSKEFGFLPEYSSPCLKVR